MEQSAWCEVRLTVPLAQSETACAIAAMAAPGGFYLEDYSDLEQQAQAIAHVDLIDEELLQKDRTRAVIHLYISPDVNPAESLAFLRDRLAENRIDARIDVGSPMAALTSSSTIPSFKSFTFTVLQPQITAAANAASANCIILRMLPPSLPRNAFPPRVFAFISHFPAFDKFCVTSSSIPRSAPEPP